MCSAARMACVWVMVAMVCATMAVGPRRPIDYDNQGQNTDIDDTDGDNNRNGTLVGKDEVLVSCGTALLRELHTITDLVLRIDNQRAVLPQPPPVIHDCSTLYLAGVKGSGVYQVFPFTFKIYCDMVKQDGGWTVIQRRLPQETQENFARDWVSYRDGFGQLRGEMWMGLEALHQLTHSAHYELRVDMIDYELGHKHAHYKVFQVGPEEDGYRLLVTNYSGNAGDALSIFHSGRRFSTYDHDQDMAQNKSCAEDKEGGWWFHACYAAHPNGRFPSTLRRTNSRDIRWWKSREQVLVLTHIEMKIRRRATSDAKVAIVEEEEERKDDNLQEEEHTPSTKDDVNYKYDEYPTYEDGFEGRSDTLPWEIEIL